MMKFMSLAMIIPFVFSTQTLAVSAAQSAASVDASVQSDNNGKVSGSDRSNMSNEGSGSSGKTSDNTLENGKGTTGGTENGGNAEISKDASDVASVNTSEAENAASGMSAGEGASAGSSASDGASDDAAGSASSGSSAVLSVSGSLSSGVPADLLEASAVVSPSGNDAFSGISVDGNFSDWDSVTREDTSQVSNGLVNEAGMVFNGDYVYLYLDEHQPGAASWSGNGNSGNFAITTDLGNVMIVHVNADGSVQVKYKNETVDGVQVSRDYKNGDWHSNDPHYRREIAIPKSALPYYNKTISFGYYLGTTFVSGVSNFDGSGGNTGSSDSGSGASAGNSDIKFDGDYADWNNYPHQVIEYDTAGTSSGVVDAEGALYSDGDTAYGHVYTSNQKNLKMGGYEFTEFNVRLNNDDSKRKMVRAVPENADGSLDWKAKDKMLADGTYTYYLFDIGGWGTSKNINDISPHDTVYGKMTITIKNGIDQTEYEMNLATLANRCGLSPNDVGAFSVQFHRLGNQWVSTAGTSTDPWLAVIICIVPTAFLFERRRKKYPAEFQFV
jgi:uncharacterized protein (TIGR04145 family)